MSTSQHSTLFHVPGPGATMDYLWSRLDDRDLSQDEALAIISAVHRRLGQSEAEDPKVYLSYSRFMESLNRQMPVVHDFVVSKWSENRYVSRRMPREADDGDGDPGADVDPASGQAASPKPAPSQALQQGTEALTVEGEESGEAGEAEEDDAPEPRGARVESGREAPSERDEGDEPESDPADDNPDEKDEPEEIEDSAAGAEAAEEGEEAEQLEGDAPEEQEAEDEESVEEEQPEQEVEAEEADGPEAEAAEAQKGESGGEEESEWPEEAEAEPPEPIEDEEGAEAEGE